MIHFSDLCEDVPDHLLPPLDRADPGMPIEFPHQAYWRRDGYIILGGFLKNDLIDAYCDRFRADRGTKSSPVINGKWRHDTPYQDVKEIRDLCLDFRLMAILKHLIGYEMAMNLNLVNWTSTERDWHQDDFLNPDYINNHYAAVWFALDDIHPDSGPFEFIPGSQKWPSMRRSKVFDAAPPEMKADPTWNAMWPNLTQNFVSAAMEEKIQQERLPKHQFLANKGDVLIWSGKLAHRGSAPNVRGMERRAIISHYSSILHRRDMPNVAQHEDQGKYFVL